MVRARKIDHVSLATNRPEEAMAFFKEVFGATCHDHFTAEEEHYHGYSMMIGDSGFELITPLDDEGFLTRFFEARGEGLHHMTIEVESLDQTVKDLAARGVEVFGRRETATSKEAFIHPRQAFGVLIQLLEGSW